MRALLLAAVLVASAALAQAAPPASGGWTSKAAASAMDDSKTVTLSLLADGEVKGWLASARPVLVLRCQEGSLAAIVATGMPAQVERGPAVTVRFRYDKDEAVMVEASKSSDSKAFFLPNPEHHIGMMLEHERLLLEFTPFRAAPQTISFDVRGLREVVGPLHQACGWE